MVALNIQLPIPTQRIAVHHLDTLGDQIVADAVGCGEVFLRSRFLAGGKGGFDFGFGDDGGFGADAEVLAGEGE